MSSFLNYNGDLLPADKPVLEDRAAVARGNGLFETMRISKGKILFADDHFERLCSGLYAMQLDSTKLYKDILQQSVMQLCATNGLQAARVRLTIFREKDNQSAYLIETAELNDQYDFPSPGLRIDIFPDAAKTPDDFSFCKTIDHQPYRDAAAYAVRQHLDDCLVQNASGNICDSSISNIFWINNKMIYTPPLSEGCIAGVMRKYLLDHLPASGYFIEEKPLSTEELSGANEVFLTNVIRGIRPIRQCGETLYEHELSRQIFTLLVQPLTNH